MLFPTYQNIIFLWQEAFLYILLNYWTWKKVKTIKYVTLQLTGWNGAAGDIGIFPKASWRHVRVSLDVVGLIILIKTIATDMREYRLE